jgi:hypothetical protein
MLYAVRVAELKPQRGYRVPDEIIRRLISVRMQSSCGMLPSLSVASDPSAYHTGSQRRPQPDAAPGSPPLERGRFEPSVPLKRDPFDFARHESARTSKLYDGRNDQVIDPASFKPGNGAKGVKFIEKSV